MERKIPTYIILSKKSSVNNKAELLSRINETLKEMWEDGSIDRLIRKYID